MNKAAIAFAVFLLPSGVFAQAAPRDAEAEVRAVVNALFDGMRKVDSAMVRPLFHAKARMFTVDARRPDTLIEASVERLIQSIGRPRTELFDERLSNVRVMIDGSLASVWTDYKFFRGTTFSHCGVDHFLLVKERGSWKILELTDTRRTENC
jgi:putative lumazine-binding protein